MAKRKSKVSASQRDKITIARAKALKKAGILTSRTNLHSGHYISKYAVKKVKELGSLAGTNVKAYKAPKEIVARAKERGFVTVGNKIVGPKTPQFRKLLTKGDVGNRELDASNLIFGVQPLRGGMMEIIQLPHSIFDLHTLYTAMGDEGLNRLKNKDEIFAFSFHGNMQNPSNMLAHNIKFFSDTQEMREYLFQYKSIQKALETRNPDNMQEEFQAIQIIRIRPEDQGLFIPTRTQRELFLHASGQKARNKKRRQGEGGKGSGYKGGAMNRAISDRVRENRRIYMEKKRAAMTPEQKAKQKDKDRKRMQKNRSK